MHLLSTSKSHVGSCKLLFLASRALFFCLFTARKNGAPLKVKLHSAPLMLISTSGSGINLMIHASLFLVNTIKRYNTMLQEQSCLKWKQCFPLDEANDKSLTSCTDNYRKCTCGITCVNF